MRSRRAETADTNIRHMGYPLSVLSTQLEGVWLFLWPEHIGSPSWARDRRHVPRPMVTAPAGLAGRRCRVAGAAADTGSDKEYRVD